MALLSAFPTAPAADGGTYSSTAFCAWDRSTFEVQIVPPVVPALYYNDLWPLPAGVSPPWTSAHAQAAVEAVEQWETAMHSYASLQPNAAHLANVSIKVDLVGPGASLMDLPEADVRVMFVPAEATAAGRTVQDCTPSRATEFAGCLTEFRGRPCIVPVGTYIYVSQWFVYGFTPNDVYTILLHEMGHALGLDHVSEPSQDVMQPVLANFPGNPETPRGCVSTLNAEQLARVFDWMTGEPYAITPVEPAILAASEYALLC